MCRIGKILNKKVVVAAKVGVEYQYLSSISRELFPVQVVPLFDVMDLVELVTMMASVGEQFESSGATCNKDFPLTAESCKWLTWKMDGLSEVESQKISACFPTISSLIEATEERLRVDLGVELAAQVSSMLQSDFHIE